MPAPVIPTLPDAPQRSDVPSVFVTKADAFVASMQPWGSQINAFGSYINGLALTGVTGPITDTALTVSTGKLLGRTTAGTGAIEEISVSGGLSLSGGTLTGPAYSFGLSIISTPTASEVLLLHIAAEAFTIPANFTDSKGACGTNPTASFAIDVQRQVNAAGSFTTIGTITISTGGAFTFATASGTSKAIAVNDVLKFVAPSSADATAANIAITIKGTR